MTSRIHRKISIGHKIPILFQVKKNLIFLLKRTPKYYKRSLP